MTAPRTLGWLCLIMCGGRAASPAAPPDEATGRLAEATLERRVFRHILVGKIRYPSERLTWVLSRGPTRAQLEVFCQDGQSQPTTGIQLDGAELRASYWLPPSAIRYAGKKTRDKPLRFELSRDAAGAPGSSWCASAPKGLVLDCSPVRIAVLPAGAILIPGKKRDDDTMSPARWKPAVRHTEAGLRCALTPAADLAAWRPASPAKTAPPVFVSPTPDAPGLEWADENSDMVAQEGAYRQIAADVVDP